MHKSPTNGTHSTLGRCQEMQLTGGQNRTGTIINTIRNMQIQKEPEQEIQLETQLQVKGRVHPKIFCKSLVFIRNQGHHYPH